MRPTHESGLRILYAPLGHAVASVSTSAVPLPSIPSDGARIRRVVIRTLGQPINYRDDGIAPTSSTGFPLLSNEVLVYDGDPDLFQMIADASATGSADVRVAYYG